MELDHFNLRTAKLAETVRFYGEVIGLTPGFRPEQPLNGAWLYGGPVAMLHLLEGDPIGLASGRVDHVAFRASGLAPLLDRLDRGKVPRMVRKIPGTTMIQVQFLDPNGVMIEVNFTDEAFEGPGDALSGESHVRLAEALVQQSRARQDLRANGIEIAYETCGTGPVMLLLHGMNADRHSFAPIIPLLARHFRCVTYDQRDTGETKNGPEAYSVADLAADAAALIAHLGVRAHIVGTSFGGTIAQELALRHPECVDRLVLSVTLQDGAKLLADPSTVALQVRAQTDPAAREELAARFFAPQTIRRRPDVVRQVLAGLVRREPDAQARRLRALQAYKSTGRVSEIRRPTLVLGAMDDRVIAPQTSWELAREIPGATLTMLSGVGHVLFLEDPQGVSRVIVDHLLRGRAAESQEL
jgi:pimeloyl-ACP methyl ester carboxylesterase